MQTALLLLISLPVWSQAIDTSYRTTYYEQKVSLFRSLPDQKGEIIFLGNSITDIAEWAELWANPLVRNRGISGDNSFGVLARLDEVYASKPEKIFLMIGINDIAKGTPDSIIISNYQKIITRLRAATPSTSLVIQSILPTNDSFTEFIRHQGKDTHIRAVNAALKTLAAQYQCTFVDLYPKFLDEQGRLDKKYTNDGLHLTAAGYLLWKAILIEQKLMN